MLPGQQFDESRLAKPGDFDALAEDEDPAALLALERQMDADLAALKVEVKAERTVARKPAKVSEERRAAEPAAAPAQAPKP